MIAPMAVLVARRTAPPSTCWILAGAAAALAWGARADILGETLDARSIEAAARREVWLALGGLMTVLTAYRAACVGFDWRRRDADAFGGAPRSRLELALATWLGAWGAAVALAAAIGLFAEARVDGAREAERELGRSPLASNASPLEDLRFAQQLAIPSGARWIEVDLGFLATDVAARVELSARRGAEFRRSEKLVSGRSRLRVEAPPGVGPVQLELRRTGGRGVVFLKTDEARFYGTPRSARWAALTTVLQAALAVAGWTSLALGLGTHLPPILATASALVLSVPSWLGQHPAWAMSAPWGALPSTLEALSRGVTPAWPSAATVASAAVCVALGLALAARGMRTWRTTR